MHTDKQYRKIEEDLSDTIAPQTEALLPNSEPVQCRFSDGGIVQKKVADISMPTTASNTSVSLNKTGLPDQLKSGLENLSGYDLSSVRVHYNSPKPEQLGALAYAQGTNIHLGKGQEKHLPHEGWHVVQQMQGRVKANLQTKGHLINDEESLEKEADVMGAKADLNGSVNKQQVLKSKSIKSLSSDRPCNSFYQRHQVKQLGRVKSKVGLKKNVGSSRRKPAKDWYFERLRFSTEFLRPWKSDWPITQTLRTAVDFIRHLNNSRSREKFTPQELIEIDTMLAKEDQISNKKVDCLFDLGRLPRSLEPKQIPVWITKMTGVPNKKVGITDLRKRIKTYFTVRLEHLLDNFFKANPDIVSKIAWSIPRIENPFKIIPNIGNYHPSNNWNSTPIYYQRSNIQPLTNAAGKSYIKFSKLTKTSKPVLLNDQSKWENAGILKDKNSPNQRLTLMHQIRGRFGGPSEQANMFLGTAASNLSNEQSHVNQVEDRIAWAITSAPKWGIKDFYVEYEVEPQFGTIAPHVLGKIDSLLGGQDKMEAKKWCEQATPKHYKTQWVLHVLLNNDYEGTYGESKTLNADE